ncbi:class II aldolase/adducin family protein [Streptomyces spiramenti]|uniref:Class II aldolase/adducin family protein n=1 Tax=Streptomyces spiramenti TaxID=2720606 RepID=A0ABX1AL37_9ACTN|nr:class II aldolase/adducin family protein [Streptomyces spiramenti]NJP66103.1 class II aldolase/adducin family protein [Streptomyces spiramenti]
MTADPPRAHPDRPALPYPPELAAAWSHLLATARRTVADGLVVGTSGNLSARVGELILITPTGVPYDRLGAVDLLAVRTDGTRVHGALAPTSELPLHLAVYRGTPATAIVHTHALHATAVSLLHDEVPAAHYVGGLLGGPVRVAPYALYGSPELAHHTVRALRDRSGCLLRNHGAVTYGTGRAEQALEQAYDRTAQLEWLCRLWLTAAAVPGARPSLLSPEQFAEATARLGGYGRQETPPTGD